MAAFGFARQKVHQVSMTSKNTDSLVGEGMLLQVRKKDSAKKVRSQSSIFLQAGSLL